MNSRVFIFLVVIIVSFNWCLAQRTVSLEEGIMHSRDSRYEVADSIFNHLLRQGDQREVLKAKAYNFSWWGKHDEAVGLFKELIRQDKSDNAAYIGLGFTHVYQGSYANAYFDFLHVLNKDANHIEANKGMAYKYFYEGKYEKSKAYFNKLIEIDPSCDEYKIALGKVALAKKENNEGYVISKEVLQLNPSSIEAQELQQEAKNNSANLEINLWGGLSHTEQNLSYGLRSMQIQFEANDRWRIGSRFDNSLATDNYRLFSQYVFAPSVWVSGGHRVIKNLYVNAEVGNRFLEGNTPLARGEIIYFGYKSSLIKASYFTAMKSKVKEYNASCGIEIPIINNVRLGTIYFFGRESRFTDNTFRWLFSSKVLFKDFTADLGYFVGNHGLFDESIQRKNINGLFIMTNLAIGTKFSWMTLINYENGINIKTTTYSTGLKYKIF